MNATVLSSTFLWSVLFYVPYKVALTFESMVAIHRRDHLMFPTLGTLIRMTTCIGWIIHQIKSNAVVESASILMALS